MASLAEIPTDWSFAAEAVADRFEDHVREQLPWYDLATDAAAEVVRHYLPAAGGRVYDLGASTGNMGRALAETIHRREVDFVGVESSAAMIARYNAPGRLLPADAAETRYYPADCVVAFLALQFIPPIHRLALLSHLRQVLRPGGALVVVDKRPPLGDYPGTVLGRVTLAGKLAAGAEPGAILAKELSLAGIQRPVNPAEFRRVGEPVEWFRFGEFSGWIIEVDA